MTKLSPKARKAVKAAYAVRQTASGIGTVDLTVSNTATIDRENNTATIAANNPHAFGNTNATTNAIDNAINSLKSGVATLEEFNTNMSRIVNSFMLVSYADRKQKLADKDVVDYGVTGCNTAFSRKTAPPAERTNMDVKPGKVAKYDGRDGKRRANNARTRENALVAASTITPDDYAATRAASVTNAPREYDTHTRARMNRARTEQIKTVNPGFVSYLKAKTNAPSTASAIEANKQNAIEAEETRAAVKVVRDVEVIGGSSKTKAAKTKVKALMVEAAKADGFTKTDTVGCWDVYTK